MPKQIAIAITGDFTLIPFGWNTALWGRTVRTGGAR